MTALPTAEFRSVVRSVRGMPTSDGAGVKLTRVIGTPMLRSVDPFLMLDEFGSDEPGDYRAGFPDHPHRGFETITYMIAGRFRHRDNKGHEGLLEAGGAQWMTAGRGIVHSEMPEQQEGLIWGFQLWLNLPASEKMRAPEYRDLQPWDIPVVRLSGGVELRVLAGEVAGAVGPIRGRATEPVYADVSLPASASATLDLPRGHEGFVYPFDGEGLAIVTAAGERPIARGELAVLGAGDALALKAVSGAARALVVAGRPLREPVVQYGPFVMNTRAQIEQAVRDYQAGRF
ncbi:MAG: pirin family protein [Deltaproteobacteria bacterium]|nr:pirin family protein [Deltaproteobacteria bacterium]